MSLIKINYHQIIGENVNSPFSEKNIGFEPDLVVNNTSRNSVYWQCPAWKHKASRTFIIRSPVDMTLAVRPAQNGQEASLVSPNLTQWQFDEYCTPTFVNDWCTAEKTTIQLSVPRFIFWTKHKNVWVESRPYAGTAIKNNLISVPAWFNVSGWKRAIGTAFDVVDVNKPIIIRRGDPIMEVCFYSKDLDAGILLKKSQPPEKLLQDMERTGLVKEYLRKYSKYFIFKKQEESKCPFSHLWKK